MKKRRVSLGIFADGHLTNNLPYTIPGDIYRKASLKKYIHEFFKGIREEKVDALIIPGDLLNGPKLSPGDIEILLTFFYELHSSKINTFVCLGNHDMDGRECALYSIHSVDFFSRLVRVHDGLFHHTDRQESRAGEMMNFHIVNFCLHKDFLTSVKKIIDGMEDGFNILIGHIGVRGALHGSTKSIRGVKQEDIERISKHFDLVVLGHFHKYQWLTDNCFYPGAIHQTRMDEEGEIPGGGIVTLEKGKKPVFERINNEFSPRFVKVEGPIYFPESIRGNIVKPILDTEGTSIEDNLVFLKELRKYHPYHIIPPRLKRTFSAKGSSGGKPPSSKRIALLRAIKELVGGEKKMMKPMYEHTMKVWEKAKREVENV